MLSVRATRTSSVAGRCSGRMSRRDYLSLVVAPYLCGPQSLSRSPLQASETRSPGTLTGEFRPSRLLVPPFSALL